MVEKKSCDLWEEKCDYIGRNKNDSESFQNFFLGTNMIRLLSAGNRKQIQVFSWNRKWKISHIQINFSLLYSQFLDCIEVLN